GEQPQAAAVRAHDAGDRGEPETVPGGLGGEERIKDPRPGLAGHAGAVVGDLDLDVGARGRADHVARMRRTVVAERATGDLYPAAPSAERIARVVDQVEQDLADLGRIAAHDEVARHV